MALTYLTFAALVVGSIAGPISYFEPTTQCARTCPDDAELPFAPGQTYQYTYASTIMTHIPGATEEASRLFLTATASVEVLERCELALRMSEVSLEDASPSDPASRNHVPDAMQFKQALMAHPLRFAMMNGRVTELCPEQDEETWVLNAKRAVLSGLQMTAPRDLDETLTLHETDVVGECDVTYSPVGSSWSTTTLRKTKDLLACTGRQDSDSIIQSIAYQAPSRLQSLPLLKSTHECEQQVNTEGRLVSTTCQESHLFRPFSREESGASTSLTYSLTFARQEASVRTPIAAIERRADMLFEHVAKPVEQLSVRRQAMTAMRELCADTEQGIASSSPALFLKLVKEMRKLDAETLTQLATQTQSGNPCARAKKFFNDALPTLSTEASLRVMKDLLLDGTVTGVEADLWMTSMTFINEPTREMLADVRALLNEAEPRRQAVLAVSSMVYSYCKAHPSCASDAEVGSIITTLEAMLGHDCSGDNHEKILLALKALGNAGPVEAASATLTRCFQNEQNPMEVRVQAVMAFRRTGCLSDREPLTRLLEDITSDSELRINAYLILMQCPDYSLIQHITSLLEQETVNQVGSFIWTHLTNLAETSSPFKQEIQRLLSNSELQRAFNMDKRKFSRNIEWSAFSETLNSGAVAESNLIWSPKSFLPRSASLNLTVDLFGQSINLMEVGGRIEGLDSVLESIFGPDPAESNETPEDLRPLDQQYRQEPSEPQGAAYLRVFGNEISFADFHGLDLSSIRDRFNYLQWLLDLASEHDYEMTKSMVLLDSELCVPTVAGFPLRLAVDGTAVTDLQLRGRLDLRNIGAPPRSLAIVGSVRPSAALQINGEMTVDAWLASTGLRMVNTFHTSTLADGTIELQNGRVFNMDINTPQESMDIFSAESKFYVIYRENAREQMMLTEGRFESSECTGSTLESALGLQLCAEMSVPKVTAPGAPWLPLTGPASTSITLNKMDTFTNYHFEARLERERVSRGVFNHLAAVSFNTPNSRIDRELTARFDLNQGAKTLSVDLRSPWKKLDFASSLESTDEMKRIMGSIRVDDLSTYELSAEVGIVENQYNTRFQPRLQLTLPEQDPYTFGGSILYRPGKRAEVDLALENVFSTPVTLRGELIRIAKTKMFRYEGDIALRAPTVKSQLAGSIDQTWSRTELTSAVSLEYKYKFRGSRQVSLSTNGRFHSQSSRDSSQLSITGGTATTLWPQYDTDVSILLGKDTTSMELAINSGLTNDKPKRVGLTARALYDLTSPVKTITSSVGFEAPFLNMAYNADVNHQHSATDVTTTVDATYDGDQQARAEVHLHKGNEARLNMSTDVILTMPGRHVAYSHKLQERAAGEYHHNLTMTLDHYNQIQMVSMYRSGDQHELTSTFRAPFTPTVSIEASLVPNLSNMQTNARVTVDTDEYAIAGAWTHRRGLNGNANLEITIPLRRITWEGQMSKSATSLANNMVFKWDADQDATKKIVTDFTMEISATQPTVTSRVQWWPNKFVEVTGTLRNDQEGWWSVTRDLEGSLQLTSSFVGYEDLNAGFTHVRSATETRTHGEVSWSPENRIDGDYLLTKNNGWSNVEKTFTLNTPFQLMRTLRLENSYNHQRGNFVSNSRVQWDDQQITIGTSCVTQGWQTIDAELRITSPFPGVEDVTFGVHHNNAEGRVESNVQALLGSDTYSLTLQMTHARTGYYITSSGSLTAVLPLYNSPNSLVWEHNNDQRSIASHMELTVQGDRSILDLNAKMRRKIEISARLNTPYFPSLSTLFTHEGVRRSYARSTVFEVTYDGQTTKVENQFDFQPAVLVLLETRFTSPFSGMEQVTLTIDNKLEGDQYVANNEFQWGSGNKMVSLTGAFSHSLPAFQGQAQVFSPWTDAITLTGANAEVTGMWQMTGSLVHRERALGRGTITLGMAELKKFNIDFHSPCPYISNLLFDIEHTGNLRDFNTRVTLEENLLPSRIQLVADINTANVDNLEANINAEAPIPGVEFLRFSASHRKISSSYQTAMSFDIPQKRVVFSNNMNAPSFTVVSSDTQVEIDSNLVYQFETSLNAENDIIASAVYRMPDTADKSITFRYEGEPTNFRTSMEINYAPSKTITPSVEFTLNSDGVRGEAQLLTPSPKWARTSVSFDHRGTLTSFSNNAALEIVGRRMTGESEFSLNGNTLNGRVQVDTPFQTLQSVQLTLNHEGDFNNFQNSINAHVNSDRFSASSEFHNTVMAKSGRFSLSSPYYVQSMNVDFEHSGNMWDFRNTANYEFNGYRASATNEFRLTQTEFHALARVNIPEEISLEINHNGDIFDFSNTVTARYYGEVITGNSAFQLGNDNLALSAGLVTPFQDYSNMGIEYTHSGPIDNFNCNLNMHWEESRITGQHSITQANDQFELTTVLQTPIRGFQTMRASVTHTGNWNDFRNEAEFRLEQEAITSTLAFRALGREVEGSVAIRTPMAALAALNLELTHNGDMHHWRNEFSASLNGQSMSGSTSYEPAYNMKQGSVSLSLPFTAVHTLSGNFHHEGQLATSFSNRMTLTMNDQSITGESSYRNSDNMIEGSASINTPFTDLRTMSVTFSHEQDSTSFSNELTASLNSDSVSGSSSLNLANSQINGHVRITTPFTTVRSFEMTMEQGNSNSVFTMQLNEQTMRAESTYRVSGNRIEGSATINTPFTSLNALRITFLHDGQPTSFTNEIVASLNGDSISSSVSFNKISSGMDGYLRFNTPFTTLRRFDLTMRHEGSMTNFNNDITLIVNEHNMRAESTFRAVGNTIEGSATINTPFTEVSTLTMSFGNELNPTSCTHEMSVTLNGEQWGANVELNYPSNRISGNARLTAPSNQMEFTFSHQGILTNFQNEVSATVNGFTVNGNSAFLYTTSRLEGSIAFVAPGYSAEISTTNQGQVSDFSNEITFKFNNDITTLQHSYQNRGSSIEGSINLSRNADFTTGLSYRHTGTMSNFDNELSLLLNEDTITFNSAFRNMEDVTELSVNVNTPFTSMETMGITMRTEGQWLNSRNALTTSLNGQSVVFNHEFKWIDNVVEGLLNVHAQDSELFAIHAKHEGSMSNFNNELTVTVNQQTTSWNNVFRFTTNQLDISSELRTPFSICEAVIFNMVHHGGMSDFSNQWSFTVNEDTIRSNTQLRIQGSEMTASYELTTPFSPISSLAITASHSGVWSDCNNHFTVTLNGESVEANSHFRMVGSQIEGSFTMNQFHVAFHHDGESSHFDNDFTISFNGEEGSLSSSMRMDQSGVNGNAHVNTPFNGYRRMAVSARTRDSDYMFQIQRDNDEFSLTTSNSRTPNGGQATFTLTTPFSSARQVTGSFSHEGPMSNFQQQGSLEINGDRLEYSVSFEKSANSVNGRFDLRTPFSGLEHFEIGGTHTGTLTNFNNNGYILVNGQRISGNTEFHVTGDIHLMVSVQTPTEYSLTINHAGNWNDFTNEVILRNADVTYSTSTHMRIDGTTVEATMTIQNPDTVRITFNHEGGVTNFRQSSLVEYSGKTMSHSCEFTVSGRQIAGKFGLASECPYLNSLNTEFSHQGRWNNFQNLAKLELNGVEYEVNSQYRVSATKTLGGIGLKIPQEYSMNFVMKGEPSDVTLMIRPTVNGRQSTINAAYKNTGNGVIETSLNVRTPYQGYRNFAMEYNYKNKRMFRTSGSIQTPFQSFENMAFEITHQGTWRQFTTTGRMNTPFTILPEASFEVTHQGPLSNFQTTGHVDLNGSRFGGTTTYRFANRRMETSTTLESPYFTSFSYAAHFEGGIRNFNTGGNVELNGDRIEGSFAFTSRPAITVSSTLRTPFTMMREMSVSLNHEGSWRDFTSTGSATLNDQTVNGNLAFRKEGEVIESSGEIQIPGIQDMSYTINHSGNTNNFRTTASVNTPFQNHRMFSLALTHEGVMNNFRSTATVTTPYHGYPAISTTLSHNGAINDFTSSATLEYGSNRIEGTGSFRKSDGWYETDIESSLHITSTFAQLSDLQISSEHHKTANSINGQSQATVNGHQQLDMDYSIATGSTKTLTVNVRSPTLIAASASISQESVDASLNWNNSPYTTHIELRNNHELTITASMPSRTVQLTTRYDLTSDNFAHMMEVQWSSDPLDRMSWNVEVSSTARGQQSVYDGRLVLTAKQYTMSTTFSHRVNPGRNYVTEVNVQGLVIRSDLTLRQPNAREFTLTVTAQHPSFTRDVVCTIEGVIEPETPRFDGRISLVYADQTFELSGKIADESENVREKRYVAEAHVTHPASSLDVQFSSQLTNNDETMGGNMEVTYMMTQDRHLKNAALRAEINKLREEINMEVQSLENHMSVTGRRTVADAETGHQHFSVSGQVDERNMHAEIDMDQSSPSFDLTFTLEPENELHVYGRYLDPSSMMIEAYRQNNGARTQDTQMSLRLHDSNILNARAYFRPQIIDDVKNLFDTDSHFGETMSQVATTITDEYSQKMALFAEAASPLVNTVEHFRAYTTDNYQQMYDNNDFYVRFLADTMIEYYDIISATISENWEALRVEYSAHFSRKMEELRQCWLQLETLWWDTVEFVSVKLQDSRDMVVDTYNDHMQTAQDTAMEWIESARSHPRVQAMIDSVTTMEPADYFIPLRESYDFHLQRLTTRWESCMSRPGLHTIKTWVENTIENVQWIYEYLEVDETVQGWIDEARQLGLETIAIRAFDWAKAKLDTFAIETISWSPSEGEYEVRITLPMNLQDLRTIPHYDLAGRFSQMTTFLEEHMPTIREQDWSVWDTIYQYKPVSTNPREWVPPFNAHATISGNQHYLTFDKAFYEFAGSDCSYLLARDFIDGRFSVLLNYVDSQRHSLVVVSNNQHIEIKPDFTVWVSGERSDLPYNSGQTTVRRIGNTVRVDNEHGITVSCDLPHDLCTVNVTGWYYGKTGGLLGTYDNEPSNDFLNVERIPASHVEDFAASWSVGRTCRRENTAVSAPEYLDEARYSMCARYFEEISSPFRPCFRQVNTTAFMSMCLNDVTAVEPERAVCNMAAFYVDECQRAGVAMRMPTDCVSCELEGHVLGEGENLTVRGDAVNQEADVVFVVSHKECNRDVLARIGDITTQIERNFRQAGINSISYGLVGYGNDIFSLNTPHSHTLGGQLFNTKDSLLEGLETFFITEGTPEDAFDAVRFAAKYPFRPLASKSILVVPCDSCHEQTTKYGELQTLLEQRGINMHVLLQHEFRLRTNSPKTSYIFGVDNQGLFTPKHVGDSELMGDAELRRQVTLPKDLCAALSDTTNGTTFNVGQLLHTRPAMQKRFLDVLSRLVVKKGTIENCKNCECVADDLGMGTTVCRSCSTEPTVRPWLDLSLDNINPF